MMHCETRQGELIELQANAGSELQQAALAGPVPTVFRGAVNSWPAIHAWSGGTGLGRMAQLAGAAPVQVMSAASDVFYGSIEQHEPEDMLFAEFLALAQHSDQLAASAASTPVRRHYLAQATIANSSGGSSSSRLEVCHDESTCGPSCRPANEVHDGSAQAQDSSSSASLAALRVDFDLPALLQMRSESLGKLQTNLWMSIRGSRSSLHYDPYQNLLCVVRGTKRVTLHSPQQTAALYPKPVHGEASNHSNVDFAQPDLMRHPAYADALATASLVELQTGDCIFIPEGWWHQIDSNDISIAINFWWQSPFAAALEQGVTPLHLRQVVRALGAQQADAWLKQVEPLLRSQLPATPSARAEAASTTLSDRTPALLPQQGSIEVESVAAQPDVSAEQTAGGALAAWEGEALRTLVVATGEALEALGASSDILQQQQQEQPQQAVVLPTEVEESGTVRSGSPISGSTSHSDRAACDQIASRAQQHELLPAQLQHRHSAETLAVGAAPTELGLQHPITRAIASLSEAGLCRVLLSMAQRFPRTLEALLLHALPPAAAELLLRSFEAADEAAQASRDAHAQQSRQQFYQTVYATVDDSRRLLQSLLCKKERFAEAACQSVLKGL